MIEENTQLPKNQSSFDPGKDIFSWQAPDYQPHQRGIIWYIIFCSIFFGGAIWAMYSDPKWGWIMSFAMFLVVAVYFYAHYKGEQNHEIKVFQRGILVDRKFFPLEKFAGFWILYDETINTVNLKFRSKHRNHKISLQMGDKSPEFFRKNFAKIKFPELEDEKESLLDLWIRALKL